MAKYEFKNGFRINTKTKVKVYTGPKSAVDPKEKRLVELTTGAKPENASEKRLVKQIQKIKDAGNIVEIPSM